MTAYITSFLTNFAAATGCDVDKNARLLGIIPKWYKYLPYTDSKGTCTVHVDFTGDGILALLPIGLALIEMLLAIAGVAAVGFVVYGGFQYVTSQGEPDHTKKALSTIINALIGGVVAIIASTAVAFLSKRIG